MVSYDVKEIRNSMAKTVGSVDAKRTDPVIVAFVCTNKQGIHGVDLPKNYRSFPVHCTSRQGGCRYVMHGRRHSGVRCRWKAASKRRIARTSTPRPTHRPNSPKSKTA